MDITLHIGAHRTGTTCFQKYMHSSSEALAAQHVAYWGPDQTRSGLLAGVYQRFKKPSEKKSIVGTDPVLQSHLDDTVASGAMHLIVSEENLMGSIGRNVDIGAFYPNVGARVACFAKGFGPNVRTIVMSVRSLDVFWCSSLAYAVANNLSIPDNKKRSKIALDRRGWRDVITDIARALPDVQIKVLPFETYVGRPDQYLVQSTGILGPACADRAPVNASPRLPELRRALFSRGKDASWLPLGTGRWNPFTNEEHSALRELFADDMMWLTGGADGLATLIEDRSTTNAGQNPPRAALEKGQCDEFKERRMARPG